MHQTIAKQINDMVDAISDWLYDSRDNGGNKYRKAFMPNDSVMPTHYRALTDTIERD